MHRLVASAAVAFALSISTAATAAEVYDQPLSATPTDDSDAMKLPEPAAVEQIENLYRLASSLPEPMNWVMMIIGFGSAGAILRRRKTLGEFD